MQIEDESVPITMTYGIAPLDDDLDSAIRTADTAMYRKKRNGRDRIVVAGPSAV